MPELPEVETIKNSLEPRVVGHTFTEIKVHDTRPLQGVGSTEFRRLLTGRAVTGLKRRGKYLVFGLSGGCKLIMHLRMTGSLLWNPRRREPYARVEFRFDNGGRLVYTDVRRFGTMNLVKDDRTITGKLGMEPLSKGFTSSFLKSMLDARPTPLKSLLLDQRRIAGMGNMYVDEALFYARLHPLRPGNSLSREEINRLHDSIQFVLKKGIRKRGASIRDYRPPDGRAGKAHEEFAVAHRLGKACPSCGGRVSRIVVGQRGTYYCPSCQSLPNKN